MPLPVDITTAGAIINSPVDIMAGPLCFPYRSPVFPKCAAVPMCSALIMREVDVILLVAGSPAVDVILLVAGVMAAAAILSAVGN